MKKIQWGIIGTGRIAELFVEDFVRVSNGEIRAVASRTVERAETFAERHEIPEAYGTYKELAENPNIDAVYIATPHNRHKQDSMLALQHNKHVLCEKPIAVNQRELTELVGMARSHKRLLMEAMWTYYLPPIQKAKEWLQKGEIGELKHIRADFGRKMENPPHHRTMNPHLAGGALLDIGIYPIAFAYFMNDTEPKQICAHAEFGETGVDTNNMIQMTFRNAVTAQLLSSFDYDLPCTAYLFGTKGHIYLQEFWQAKTAKLYTGEKTEYFEDNRTTRGYNYQVEAAGRLILEGKTESPLITHKNSLRLAETMDNVRRQIGLEYPFED